MHTTISGTVAATTRTSSVHRQDLRHHGERFAERLFEAVNVAAHRHSPIPGGMMTKDLLRGRSVSVITYGAVLAAIALTDPTEVQTIFASLAAWLQSVNPTAPLDLKSAAIRESVEQGEADAAVWAASDAAVKKDRGALDRAIREVAEHIAALEGVLTSLQAERAAIPTPSRPKYRVIAPTRLVAANA